MDVREALLLNDGVYHQLARPALNCEGWGPAAGHSHWSCDGGPGLMISRRGRWARNSRLYCGACKRADEAWRAAHLQA